VSLQNLRNCRICGKLYTYFRGPDACEGCRVKLDEVYHRARTILREAGPEKEYDNNTLAEELGVEPVMIHILAEEGLFERDGFSLGGDPERKKLAKEFEAELKRKEEEKALRRAPAGGMFMDIRRDKKN